MRWVHPKELVPWLAALAALVGAGYAAGRNSDRPATTVSTAAIRALPRPTATATTTQRTTIAAPAARPTLTIRARRGDCWLEARAGSAGGQLLFIGVLRHGRTTRLHASTIWARLGAPPNVDVLVNGRKEPLPRDTVTRIFHL